MRVMDAHAKVERKILATPPDDLLTSNLGVAMPDKEDGPRRRHARIEHALSDPALRSAFAALGPMRMVRLVRRARRRRALAASICGGALVLVALFIFLVTHEAAWAGAATLLIGASCLIWRLTVGRATETSPRAASAASAPPPHADALQREVAALRATGLLGDASAASVIMRSRLFEGAGPRQVVIDVFEVEPSCDAPAGQAERSPALMVMLRARLNQPCPGTVLALGRTQGAPAVLSRLILGDALLDESFAVYASDPDVAGMLSHPVVATAMSALLRAGANEPPTLSIQDGHVALMLRFAPADASLDAVSEFGDKTADIAVSIARAASAFAFIKALQETLARRGSDRASNGL